MINWLTDAWSPEPEAIDESEDLGEEEEESSPAEPDSHLWWLAGAIARHSVETGLIAESDPFSTEFTDGFSLEAEAAPSELGNTTEQAQTVDIVGESISGEAEFSVAPQLGSDFSSEFCADFGCGSFGSGGSSGTNFGGNGPSGGPAVGSGGPSGGSGG